MKKNYLIYQTPKMYDKYWNVFLCHFIQYSIKSCFWWMVYITAWFESSKYINFLQKNLNISILTHMMIQKQKYCRIFFFTYILLQKKCAHIHAFFEICKFAPPFTHNLVTSLDEIWKKPLNKSECQIYFEKF